ncbi:MAG: hypothetical protein E6G68_04375, partial [Actinobacteria bacterium]
MTGMLAALVACAAKASPRLEEPPLRAIPVINDWRQIVLPLDCYELGIRDTVLVERAQHKLVGECMRRFGFTWDVPFNERDVSGVQIPHYRLYGLLDEEHAAAYGYNAGSSAAGGKTDETAAPISPDYANVLGAKGGGGTYKGMQIPKDGCYGEARRKVAEGGPAFDSSLPEGLSADSWARANKDSRVLAAFARWSACMANSGYSYRTPMDANNDSRWDGDRPTAAEIGVAKADVQCKKQTNLTG